MAHAFKNPLWEIAFKLESLVSQGGFTLALGRSQNGGSPWPLGQLLNLDTLWQFWLGCKKFGLPNWAIKFHSEGKWWAKKTKATQILQKSNLEIDEELCKASNGWGGIGNFQTGIGKYYRGLLPKIEWGNCAYQLIALAPKVGEFILRI